MKYKITLTKSKKECFYDSEKDAVFSIADKISDALGIDIKIGCRNGYCKVCRCELKKGEVEYFSTSPEGLEMAEILPCSCAPTSDVEVEL